MGEIIAAGIVAHVPTIVLPRETRLELNEGREISLVDGLRRIRSHIFDELKPETVIVLDTHWATTVEFVVTSHERRSGFFTSDELPRGMSSVPYDIVGDPQLAQAIAAQADGRDDAWITAIDNPHLPIHYATVNLLGFLQGGERWISISCCQTAETDDYLNVGAMIAAAIAETDRRVIILASGAFSHRFRSLQTLRAHESSDPTHIISEAARKADAEVIAALERGDHASVIDGIADYLKVKPEANFGHYLMMAAALGGRECRASGRPMSDYENSIGTAQMHLWFDRPETGWTTPSGVGTHDAPMEGRP